MLSIISCWADGHAAGAARALAAQFPQAMIQPKGLIATEGIISIPFRGQYPLAIRSHYFEFVDDDGRVVGACDVDAGKTYSVLLTNGAGLWRYRLHDLVEVTGRIGQTPCIRFVGKGSLISDRVGEKLSEGFVAETLRELFAGHGLRPTFAMLAPEADARECGYVLYTNVDAPIDFADELDRSLGRNPHYAYARRLRQLSPARVERLYGDPYAVYCDRMRGIGQRLGDIKPVALSPMSDWSGRFGIKSAATQAS